MRTNSELIRILKEVKLTRQEVADILYYSISTVDKWVTKKSTMPMCALELLKIKLGECK